MREGAASLWESKSGLPGFSCVVFAYSDWVRKKRRSGAVPALPPAGSTQAPQANNRSVPHIESNRVRDKFQQKWQAAKDNFFRPIKEVGWQSARGYHSWHGPPDYIGLQAYLLGSLSNITSLDGCRHVVFLCAADPVGGRSEALQGHRRDGCAAYRGELTPEAHRRCGGRVRHRPRC